MNTCKRIKGKDYEKAGGTAILNVVPRFLHELYETDETFDIIHAFCKDNVKDFKRIWGEQSCCWVGYGRFWVWKHEREHCDIYALVCPHRGTSYEISFKGDESKAINELKIFMTELKTILTEKKHG